MVGRRTRLGLTGLRNSCMIRERRSKICGEEKILGGNLPRFVEKIDRDRISAPQWRSNEMARGVFGAGGSLGSLRLRGSLRRHLAIAYVKCRCIAYL